MQKVNFSKKIVYFLLGTGILCVSSCAKVQKTYYPNGKVEAEVTYRHGRMDGKAIWYYEHGKIRMEANYEKGRLQGEMVRYFRNGKVENRAYYHLDTLEGEMLQYDEEEGFLSESTQYLHGRKHGRYVCYHDGEQKMVEGAYFEDEYDGDWTYWDVNGFVVGRACFQRGKGELVAYDDRDSVIRRVSYLHSRKEGKELYYDRNGAVEKTLYYKEGRLVP